MINFRSHPFFYETIYRYQKVQNHLFEGCLFTARSLNLSHENIYFPLPWYYRCFCSLRTKNKFRKIKGGLLSDHLLLILTGLVELCQIETVKVHHFCPGCHKIIDKFIFRIPASIDFSDRTEL